MRTLLVALLVLGALPFAGGEEEGIRPTRIGQDDDQGYETRRPMLGINMTPIPARVQQRNDLALDQGVYVASVIPGSAATELGIRPGDVILSVSGSEVNGPGDMVETVQSHEVGSDASVVISREGQRLELTGATIKPWPDSIPYPYGNGENLKQINDYYHQMQEAEFAQLKQQTDQMAKDLQDARQALNDRKPGVPGMESARTYRDDLPAWRIDAHHHIETNDSVVASTKVPDVAAKNPAEQPWRLSYHSP